MKLIRQRIGLLAGMLLAIALTAGALIFSTTETPITADETLDVSSSTE
ncbi:hypothetical protein [Ponticaulis sp.]|nr:hypothetical protein [Ponticaulis sp.]